MFMWAMAQSSITLSFAGKPFADSGKVYRQLALGVLVTAIILIALVKIGAPLWIASLVAGLIGGGLQPYLFRDLRYR
jgi:hypothetical protein